MHTRRNVLGAGLALVSVACTASFAAAGPTTQRSRPARAIDALLIDETIDMPAAISGLVSDRRQSLPVVGIRLDAAAHTGLMSLLARSDALVGISCGATLFCVERLAWDHGFRLTARSQQTADAQACGQVVAAYLNGAQPSAPSRSARARCYRPSRGDGLLHAWVMHKSTRES
jgi:hypothetical protein